jgi:hypothetical protein
MATVRGGSGRPRTKTAETRNATAAAPERRMEARG